MAVLELEIACSLKNSPWDFGPARLLLTFSASHQLDCTFHVKFSAQKLLAQLLQPAKVVMSNISYGLPGRTSDFGQRVALHKVKQGLALVLGQDAQRLLHSVGSKGPIQSAIKPFGPASGIRQRLRQVLQVESVVKVPSGQVTSPAQCPPIGH